MDNCPSRHLLSFWADTSCRSLFLHKIRCLRLKEAKIRETFSKSNHPSPPQPSLNIGSGKERAPSQPAQSLLQIRTAILYAIKQLGGIKPAKLVHTPASIPRGSVRPWGMQAYHQCMCGGGWGCLAIFYPTFFSYQPTIGIRRNPTTGRHEQCGPGNPNGPSVLSCRAGIFLLAFIMYPPPPPPDMPQSIAGLFLQLALQFWNEQSLAEHALRDSDFLKILNGRWYYSPEFYRVASSLLNLSEIVDVSAFVLYKNPPVTNSHCKSA